jgi:hypothetical protein
MSNDLNLNLNTASAPSAPQAGQTPVPATAKAKLPRRLRFGQKTGAPAPAGPVQNQAPAAAQNKPL